MNGCFDCRLRPVFVRVETYDVHGFDLRVQACLIDGVKQLVAPHTPGSRSRDARPVADVEHIHIDGQINRIDLCRQPFERFLHGLGNAFCRAWRSVV